MDVQERLKEYLISKSLNYRAFEECAGLSNASAKRLSGSSRKSTFVKIAKAFPELNVEWLKTGEGEMLRSQTEAALPLCPSGDGMASRLMEEIAAQRRIIETAQEQIRTMLALLGREG